MTLREKMAQPSVPVTLFEVVPPAPEPPEFIQESLDNLGRVKQFVDGVNIPEIHDEDRGAERISQFVPRLEPRVYGSRIRDQLKMEVVLNHVVVRDADPKTWFRETYKQWGLENIILVGGEASGVSYPGPSVTETAALVRSEGLPVALGGITIPSRKNESDRIRAKAKAGIDFFTSQILFDSNDVVWLVQRLNGVEARIFLSFAPVTHRRDLQFLRWLGQTFRRTLTGSCWVRKTAPHRPRRPASRGRSIWHNES